MSIDMSIYKELIAKIKKNNLSERQLNALKRELAVKYNAHSIPTNIHILLNADEQDLPLLKKKLLTKPTRTISGVSPIAVMTSPAKCPHGRCTFCPGGPDSPWGDVPQSYSGHEPATMRGIRNNYDAYLQVFNRLEQYVLLGHSFDKIEIIIMGGTFTARDDCYQDEFILDIYQALNDFSDLFFEKDNKAKNKFNFLKFKEFFELPAADLGDIERTQRIQKKLLNIKNNKQNSMCIASLKLKPFEKQIISATARGALRERSALRKKTTRTSKMQKMGKLSHFCIEMKSLFHFLCYAHTQNDKISIRQRIEQEQIKNETSNIRCVALCIETKPDCGYLEQGNRMLEQGCTRVELGIQSVYDDVLKAVNRGHTAEDSKRSIRILRDLGFKINFHYMPGLPLTDEKRDLAGMRKLFSDPDYRPDMIKLYPCMVAEGTPLYQQWKKGEFAPLTTEEAAKRVAEFYTFVPEYCRIQRVQRDVPTKYWKAGVNKTNLRQYTEERFAEKRSRDIRAREPKGKNIDWDKIRIKVMEYEASKGKEFFISAEDVKNDLLIGFCRLRFPSLYSSKEDSISKRVSINSRTSETDKEDNINPLMIQFKKKDSIIRSKPFEKQIISATAGGCPLREQEIRKLSYFCPRNEIVVSFLRTQRSSDFPAMAEKMLSFENKRASPMLSSDNEKLNFMPSLRPEITKNSAIIRELHIYGTATAIGDEGLVQHKGYGRKLMQKAEQIAKKNGKDKIIVISGVGVREYYRKLGYEKEGPYMVKYGLNSIARQHSKLPPERRTIDKLLNHLQFK